MKGKKENLKEREDSERKKLLIERKKRGMNVWEGREEKENQGRDLKFPRLKKLL